MAKKIKPVVGEIKIFSNEQGEVAIKITGFSHIEALGLLRLYEQKQSIFILKNLQDQND